MFKIDLGKLDLASPAGKLMLTMLAAVAEMGRDLLAERTQSGLMRAKAEGKTLGCAIASSRDWFLAALRMAHWLGAILEGQLRCRQKMEGTEK